VSGNLAYGEGDARCPGVGVGELRLKKLMSGSCKANLSIPDGLRAVYKPYRKKKTQMVKLCSERD
jgi:hypothetical protein